jgi:hypothetical protein
MEAARILRPGGLLLAADVSRTYIHNEDAGVNMTDYLPASQQYRETMGQLLRADGFDWSGDNVPVMMADVPTLGPVDSIVVTVSDPDLAPYERTHSIISRCQ